MSGPSSGSSRLVRVPAYGGRRLSAPEGNYSGVVTPGPEVTVILPTFNERPGLEALRPRLAEVLEPYSAEILIVDDSSPDGTGDLVRSYESEGVYRLIERQSRDGLATAVLDGIREARGDIVVVMDADGSHPPERLPELIEPIRTGAAEFVLGSRHLPGASAPGLTVGRWLVSSGAALLARPLTGISDPMSGFFAFDRSIVRRARLAPAGFKIGLEIVVKCRPRPLLEVPFCFGSRIAGISKLGTGQVFGYARHLSRLYSWRLRGSVAVPNGHGFHPPALGAASGDGRVDSGRARAQRVQYGGEPAEGEAGGPGFADERGLAHEVEPDPGEAGGNGDRDETAREQPEGAFPTAAPGVERVVADRGAEYDHAGPERDQPFERY